MTSSSILNTFAAATNNRSRLKKDHNHIYNGNSSTATNIVVDETDNRAPMEATSTITASNNTGQENGSISSAASSPKSSFINDYCNGGSGESATKPPPSSSIRVRLLVFLEDCDGTRSVIFDSAKFSSSNNRSSRHNHDNSSSVGKMSTGTKTTLSGVDISNNFNKSSLSSTHLSNEMMIRMVFGSFPMKVSNNVAIKVHALKYILIALT